MPALLAEFGPDFATLDGALDRAKMRALVFADPGARARLEGILHPRIREATVAAALLATGPYVMFVVPLLIESGTWRERVARVLAIDCPEEVQVARVMARNGLPEAQVRAIMAAQVTRAERQAAADDIILNDDGLDALMPQVERLHAFYLAEAARFAALPNERL
jgi:dephospho-CoA kinase